MIIRYNNHPRERGSRDIVCHGSYNEEQKEMLRNAKSELVGFMRDILFSNETISRHKLEARPKTKGILTLIRKDCD